MGCKKIVFVMILSVFMAVPFAAAGWTGSAVGDSRLGHRLPNDFLNRSVFPSDNMWNTPIDTMPVDGHSADYITSIGSSKGLHPDFGTFWMGLPIGIPFCVINGSTQPKVFINYTAYGGESDPGPMPIPPDAPIEGNGSGDAHVLVVDSHNWMLYELYSSSKNTNDSWNAMSGAIYDLNSNMLRPDGWTSADAAGLPIFPGLVTYDEVESGSINHAIRFTVAKSQKAYVWPARHYASSSTNLSHPPMGQYFRLKAGVDISGYPTQVQVILTAMKKYGIILADNGSDWFISGAPDPRWDDDVLSTINGIKGSDFEAVNVSSLMIDADSGQALNPYAPELNSTLAVSSLAGLTICVLVAVQRRKR